MSDHRPARISIVTPSFNQGPFLERTIRSVLDQGYPNLDYIIIDGGSTDNSLEIIKRYADRLRWISEPDRGQSDAINKGFRMADGDIVAFLNSDDTYEPGSLAAVEQYFSSHPDRRWAYGQCWIIDEFDKRKRQGITRYKNFLMRHYSYFKLLCTNFINQPATFWRRSVFDQDGYLDEQEHLAMDYEFWLRIGRRGPAGYIDRPLANFRMYSASKSVGNFRQQFRDELRLAKRYAPRQYLARVLHVVNYAGIVFAYTLLGKLRR